MPLRKDHALDAREVTLEPYRVEAGGAGQLGDWLSLAGTDLEAQEAYVGQLGQLIQQRADHAEAVGAREQCPRRLVSHDLRRQRAARADPAT